MMIERPCFLPEDQDTLTELWLTYRVATSVEIYPTIWRSRLLLTSRVWEPDLDTPIWINTKGDAVAFAMLWRRQPHSPYLVLDYCVHPETNINEILENILVWGINRARAISQVNQVSLTLFTGIAQTPTSIDKRLQAFGFEPNPPNDEEYNLYFEYHLASEPPKTTFPSGYETRLLQLGDDLAAYASLYNFTAVNSRHLDELLTSDEYHHRVLTDPQGKFVAFCEYSICRAEWQRSGKRLGWIDYIGTLPKNQRQGLGCILLFSSLQHLKTLGTETVRLVTASSNTPAVKFYHYTGFNPINVAEPPGYRMEFDGH